MAYCRDHVAYPDFGGLVEEVADEGAASHLEQWFGDVDSAGDQAGAIAPCHQPSTAQRHLTSRGSWSGTPVFPGWAKATVAKWAEGRNYPNRAALVAGSLSIAVAQDAVCSKVAVILTGTGSFACHGANILRSLAYPRPIWISDIADLNDIKEGSEIEIAGGQIILRSPRNAHMPIGEPSDHDIQTWQHAPSHEIAEWDLSDALPKLRARCYWSHRRYDPLTASIMIPGLRINIEKLTGVRPSIGADEYGLLWFKRAPSIELITSLALNQQLAGPLVADQLNVYERLLQEFQELHDDPQDALYQVTRMLQEYFSVHLLLHNTYEHVFITCHDRLISSGWSRSQAVELLDLILTPPVLSWQAQNRADIHKDLLAVQQRLAGPGDRTPISDAVEHEQRIAKYVAERSPVTISAETTDYCAYAARVAVAKEWKFVINKLLFSAFGETAHAVAGRLHISPRELRLIPIKALMQFLEAGLK